MATRKNNKLIKWIKGHFDAMFWITIISMTVVFYYIAPIVADVD